MGINQKFYSTNISRRQFFGASAGAASLLLLAGCSSGTDSSSSTASDTNSEEKVIRIGCEATTPGWAQTDEKGNISGYDFDVWEEIGKRTGYTIDYQVMDWDGMWVMLENDRLDTVGEQISYSAERADKYYLTDPYGYNIYSVLCRADATDLNSMDDLKSGMKVACESNTSDETVVKAIDEEYGIELEPTWYDGMSLQDVVLGRCDLWLRAYTSCVATVKEISDLKILGNTNVVESNVYPFAKTEKGKELSELVSKTINEMKEDGTLKKLSEKWFNTDITEKPEGAIDLA